MDYSKLNKEDFDAIATGELTHLAIWLEDELIAIISNYFFQFHRRATFERLLLRRDGLTFQDKIEIVRALLPLFSNQGAASRLKSALIELERFKALRNAFAHGIDVTPEAANLLELHVEIVNRAGKERTFKVTPESHDAVINAAEKLLETFKEIQKELSSDDIRAFALEISNAAATAIEKTRGNSA